MEGSPLLPKVAYSLAWAFLAAWFAFWELLALFDPGAGDTLTEHLRPLIQSTVTGVVLAGLLLVWLALHFLVEGR